MNRSTRTVPAVAAGRSRESAPASTAPLRLTRRGRVVIVLAVLAALMFFALAFSRASSQASTSSGGPATKAVTVEPGQTLWQIAKSVAPGDDPRDTVARIEAMNPSFSGVLQAGQQLVVPA